MIYSIIYKNRELIRKNSTKQLDTGPLKLPKWTIKANLTPSEDFPNIGFTAIHTGYSNLLVLDFDTPELFEQALKLDNQLNSSHQCQYIAQSIDETNNIKGGHFYYKLDPSKQYDLLDYINNPNGKKLNKLDTLYGNTLVYFANDYNKTKNIIRKTSYQNLTEIPMAMQLLVINHYKNSEVKDHKNTIQTYNHASSKLGFIAEKALNDDKALDTLLSIITPQRYKYILTKSPKHQYPRYHPDNLPEDESAHMYIVSLSGVLMLDQSIDSELHQQLIIYLNSLFSQPLDDKRINSILKRDINSEKYTYNPNWKKDSFIIYSKQNHPLEVFLLSENGQINYLVYDHYLSSVNIIDCIIYFKNASSVVDYLYSQTGIKVFKDKIIQNSLYIDIISRPDEPFGYIEPKYDDTGNLTRKALFNTYIQTPEQKVFYNPDLYRESWSDDEKVLAYDITHPRYPKVTLKALSNSIGKHLPKFLSFMARKYKTRDHSPLFFVLYGVPHSFKSAIVNGVFSKLSHNRYKTVSLEVLTDKYNDWQVNTDLVLLDEVHHYLTQEKIKMIKVINELTGASTINGVRRMHQTLDARVYPNEITFFLTTNSVVQLTTEVNDRRMVVFKSLTPVSEALNMSNYEIEKAIKQESLDFAYYLSQIEPLMDDSYITNYSWKDDNYSSFIENSQSMEHKIVKALEDNNLDKFVELLIENGLKITDITSFIEPFRGVYRIRLHNSREDTATIDSMCNYVTLDEKKLLRLLQLSKRVQYRKPDYKNSVPTGNRKTFIEVKKLPKLIKDNLNKVDGLEIKDEQIDL